MRQKQANSLLSTALDTIHMDLLVTAVRHMPNSVTVELSDIPSNVDSFVTALSQFEIEEMCRTGVTAL